MRDSGAPGHAHGRCAPGPCARAPTGRMVSRLKPPLPREPSPLPHTAWERSQRADVSPKGAARPLHRPGAQLGLPLSAALLGPSTPALPLNNLASIPPICPWERIVSATHCVFEDERSPDGGDTYQTRLRSVVRLPTRTQCWSPPRARGTVSPPERWPAVRRDRAQGSGHWWTRESPVLSRRCRRRRR